ncbi:MAG: NPCBM/NEW2 domain-containing protein [Planctomycetes bacterium]|nr:NPCBM/NEW2 domain-containing protein [Planctomycetota bacterium]
MRRLLGAAAVAAVAGVGLAQAPSFEVLLAEGSTVVATALRGAANGALVLETATGPRTVPTGGVLAVFGVPTVLAPLPVAWLQGGDVLHGALCGGDAGGNRFELQSPVVGRVALDVDRLATFAQASVATPRFLRLPEGVEEALFVKAAVGHDIVAGTVHQFGDAGVRFQPDGAAAPRWYRPDEFVALRLQPAPATGAPAAVWLTTRLGDRLAVSGLKFTANGASAALAGDAAVVVAAADLASVSFVGGAIPVGDLTPAKVEESGFDGEVVHPFQVDSNALGGPLVSGGRSYGKGLGVHSKSRLVFTVPPGVDRFWTRVGFDDSVQALRLQPKAVVRVLVDGKVVFEASDLAVGQPPRTVGPLPVLAGGTLQLEVDHGAGRDLGDRVDWLSPVLLPVAKKP